jgi:hypothetical protein
MSGRKYDVMPQNGDCSRESNDVRAALMSGRKYDVIPQNGDCSRESDVRNSGFFRKQSPLSKREVVTELNMEKIQL